ncbi:unnamed protein product [Leptidea sinapis]|nr:unnamed protein product [Leptidea sinapis]
MGAPDGNHNSSIIDFYAGKSVFITGGTGFLGKVLIEKLLYSCKDIKNIYMLIREKRGVPAQERIKKMLDTVPFARLKERTQLLSKIVPIHGDLTSEYLGISPEDQETIYKEVSIVFHLAATIKFNEPLSVAMKVNVEGTREVMKLAQKMKNLKSFVYMSTAFSNTDNNNATVEEKMYPPPKSMEEVYQMIRDNDPNERFTPEDLDGRPNTYTFTKALAENYVVDNHGDMPTVIIRPSVVTAALRDPVPGWIDNWQGATPVLTLIAKGWVRTLYGDKSYNFEIIPVDYVVNLTVICGATCQKSEEVPVYHCCSSSCNPITLKQTSELYTEESCKIGFNELPFPGLMFSKSMWFLTLMTLLLQTIPAYIADLFLFIIGKQTSYVKVQNKLASYLDTIRYFTSHSWLMMTGRSRALYSSLNSEDRSLFPCDATFIDWKEYIPIYFRGVKKFLVDASEKSKKS